MRVNHPRPLLSGDDPTEGTVGPVVSTIVVIAILIAVIGFVCGVVWVEWKDSAWPDCRYDAELKSVHREIHRLTQKIDREIASKNK